jgi:hypothetical protein
MNKIRRTGPPRAIDVWDRSPGHVYRCQRSTLPNIRAREKFVCPNTVVYTGTHDNPTMRLVPRRYQIKEQQRMRIAGCSKRSDASVLREPLDPTGKLRP